MDEGLPVSLIQVWSCAGGARVQLSASQPISVLPGVRVESSCWVRHAQLCTWDHCAMTRQQLTRMFAVKYDP